MAEYKYTIDGNLVETITITLLDGREVTLNMRDLGIFETIFLPKRKRKEFGHKLEFLLKEDKYDAFLAKEGVITFRTETGHKPLLWIKKRERE